MVSFRTPTRFYFFDKKNYPCPHITIYYGPYISRKVPISPNMPNIAEFFEKKTFGDIGPPPVVITVESTLLIFRMKA